MGISSILNIGRSALSATQASIQTTGNNIANIDNERYSRQAVRLQARVSLMAAPGQMGQGVEATEVVRYFDRFIENAYTAKLSQQMRYDTSYSLLRNVENVFNESTVSGVSDALNAMFAAWNTLAQEPDSTYARTALIEAVNTLNALMRNSSNTMQSLQEQMDELIGQEVMLANSLIAQIAQLNGEINAQTVNGRTNANSLMDQRDQLTRQLAEILDISIDDKGAGNFNITTGSGLMLVQGNIPFSLQFNGPRVENSLTGSSVYNGTVEFSGSDGYEYTVQIVSGGTVDTTGAVPPPAGTATYRVSLDGGRTWLKDDNGADKIFYATDAEHSAKVNNLEISFTGTTALSKNDSFLITPKSDVYWVSSTAGLIDISTQIYSDGIDNNQRITGGVLAGYLGFRDYQVNQYMDRLDEFAKALIWEVNRIHSQGAGLEHMSYALGDYRVGRTDLALGSSSSGFLWSEYLQAGNMSFAIYDSITGEAVIDYPGIDVFSPANFDPATHSLEDVVAAINSGPAGAYLSASIVDNRLQLVPKNDPDGHPYQFGILSDTSGLAAALGINTFFSGSGASDISVRAEVATNSNLVNASRVNGAGEANTGDNITARDIAALANKTVSIGRGTAYASSQSLSGFYATLVAKVGADTSSAKYTAASEGAMAEELYNRQEEISGINLDEEMTNLIKFQSSYKAAAKLITTADEMLQTLLSIKQ